jgi:hypothetical protein
MGFPIAIYGKIGRESFASVMIIVQDFSRSPVSISFHSTHSPAIVMGC